MFQNENGKVIFGDFIIMGGGFTRICEVYRILVGNL